jgi:hypothetical protein
MLTNTPPQRFDWRCGLQSHEKLLDKGHLFVTRSSLPCRSLVSCGGPRLSSPRPCFLCCCARAPYMAPIVASRIALVCGGCFSFVRKEGTRGKQTRKRRLPTRCPLRDRTTTQTPRRLVGTRLVRRSSRLRAEGKGQDFEGQEGPASEAKQRRKPFAGLSR